MNIRRILPILFVFLLTACIDYEQATEALSLSIQLVAPEGVDNSKLAGQTITLKSREGYIIKLLTDDSGKASATDFIPDIYTISTNWSVDAAHIITGSLSEQRITASGELRLQLQLIEVRDLLIGKVYMAGAKDRNGVNYLNGSYIELYNQGDLTLDVAGLYIGLLEAGSSQAYTLDQLHEQHADSVVLLKQIFRIPAATPHPVAPGGTVLLVNSAIDHSLYSDMEHSLLDADYEAKDNLKKVTNNKDVPALETTYLQTSSNMSNMNLVRGGPCGVVIFQTNEDVSQWPTTYKYPNTETKGAQWLLLPKRLIIDGVDILHRKNSGIDISTKRLYPDIDAGYAVLNSINGLDGEVIYRKTSEMRGSSGQRMLVDTNNSTNDFQTSKTIQPRAYDEEATK